MSQPAAAICVCGFLGFRVARNRERISPGQTQNFRTLLVPLHVVSKSCSQAHYRKR